jgi:hypothetical protein
MELHRAIIYTTEMSKQVTKSHVRDAAHMYSVSGGAGLTHNITHYHPFQICHLIECIAFDHALAATGQVVFPLESDVNLDNWGKNHPRISPRNFQVYIFRVVCGFFVSLFFVVDMDLLLCAGPRQQGQNIHSEDPWPRSRKIAATDQRSCFDTIPEIVHVVLFTERGLPERRNIILIRTQFRLFLCLRREAKNSFASLIITVDEVLPSLGDVQEPVKIGSVEVPDDYIAELVGQTFNED